MTIFADTSALLAVLDANDEKHPSDKAHWEQPIPEDASLACTNYILVETFTLAQRRLGMSAVRSLQEDALPVIAVGWVDAQTHASGVSALLIAGRKELSLVDCVGFEKTMRRLGIDTAFALRSRFRRAGVLRHSLG